jgi:hypothetical protein
MFFFKESRLAAGAEKSRLRRGRGVCAATATGSAFDNLFAACSSEKQALAP